MTAAVRASALGRNVATWLLCVPDATCRAAAQARVQGVASGMLPSTLDHVGAVWAATMSATMAMSVAMVHLSS